jgi:hypothetical protein
MKVLTRLTWGSAKFWLCAIAVIGASLAVARDRTPANATGPEVLPSLSGSSATYAANVFLVKGGRVTNGNLACTGANDPTGLCLHIWAKGVNNSTGVSAFQLHYTYPSTQLAVSADAASTTWLSSTGRSVICPTASLIPGDGLLSCNTLGASPSGPTGDGILANIAVESTSVTGLATFTLASDTWLLDTPWNGSDPAVIPATIRSISIYVAPCADLVGGDGKVSAADILYVVGKYHTSDPGADLDANGLVTAADILMAVGEYGVHCTR